MTPGGPGLRVSTKGADDTPPSNNQDNDSGSKVKRSMPSLGISSIKRASDGPQTDLSALLPSKANSSAKQDFKDQQPIVIEVLEQNDAQKMMDSSLVLNQSQDQEESKSERRLSRNRSVDAAGSPERRMSNKLETTDIELLQLPTPSKQPQDASFDMPQHLQAHGIFESPLPSESAQKRQIQKDLHEHNELKKRAVDIIKRDMTEQSDSIQKRVAARTRSKMSRSMNRLNVSGLNSAMKDKECSQPSPSSTLAKYQKKGKKAVARPNRFETEQINFASMIGEVTYIDDEAQSKKKDVELSYEIVDSQQNSNTPGLDVSGQQTDEKSYIICSDNASVTETIDQKEIEFKAKYDLEKNLIDNKYRQQVQTLELKAKNAITKRLIAKVNAEWQAAVEKKKNDFQEYHNHVEHTLSAIYFLKSDEDKNAKLHFKRPFATRSNDIKSDNNEIFDERQYYKPIPGSVIVFPSSLEHCVEKENSNETRITMAYNFNMNNKSRYNEHILST